MSNKGHASIFDVQPPECRKPLIQKQIEWGDWYKERPGMITNIERVLYFDPTEVYNRIGDKIDPFRRHQSISVEMAFPQPARDAGKCTCGCNEVPKAYDNGKYFKYATDSCNYLVSNVVSIINNYFQKPSVFITHYSGKICDECKDAAAKYLELDHILGVKEGGGGCWLSNYRWLCPKCHVDKTNKSRRIHIINPNQTTIQLPPTP